MERDEIIKLARETGGLIAPENRSWIILQDDSPDVDLLPMLERFADLVAASERERIAKKIEKLPFGDTSQSFAVWVRQDVP